MSFLLLLIIFTELTFKMMQKTEKTPAGLFAAKALASQVKKELLSDILPYWRQKVCRPEGGFWGKIDGNELIHPDAPVGSIMTARILWTFASAYRLMGNQNDLDVALQAKELLLNNFYDHEHGGIYWSIAPSGTPLDTKKQIYAIAFAIYGLAELHRATGDERALDYAVKLYHSIEEHSFDSGKGGYFEAFTREWGMIEDMRLSAKDANESKTMNTHLHVLEAYACLYRVWKSDQLQESLLRLIETFEKHIVGADGHLRLFFNNDWECRSTTISYGHDIEASWLLHEAALVLDDKDVIQRVEELVPRIVEAADEGFCPEEGMKYEKHGPEGPVDGDRHWWVQAESVVGYFNIWDRFGSLEGIEKALMCWDFIKADIIDHINGEWFWSVRSDGSVNRDEDKAGFWKCPYHNGRMCMEILERL